MRNPGVSQDLTGLAAAVQLRLRVAIGLQTLIVKSRLLTGENSVRIRGDPPFQCSRSSKYQSATLRTSWLQVRVLPGVPFRRVSPTTRGAPLRTERLGVEIPHAAQTPIGLMDKWINGLLQRGAAVFSPAIHYSSNPSLHFWEPT